MRNSQIEVRPIAGGNRRRDPQCRRQPRPRRGHTIGNIRKALLDHCVIFFREQNLDAERHKAFTRRFGKIFLHPNYVGTQADPEIVVITREPGDSRIVGEDWHADTTMVPEPPMGAILYAVEVPPYGGDTLFANQYLAYATLSDGMKHLLSRLRGLHSDRNVAGPRANRNAQRSTKVREDADWRETVSAHPVVVTHPETGRKLLYVNRSYTQGFEGMTEERAGRSWTICSSTVIVPNSPVASVGKRAPLPFGTIVAASISPFTMPDRFGG